MSRAARGRPVSLEKREAILSAAAKLFASGGYAVSMDEIAAEAGVSKQTLYGHFSNKETLFRAYAETWKAHYLEGLEAGRDPRQMLETIALRMLRKLTGDAAVLSHRRLIEQSVHFPDLARLHDELGPQHSIRLVATHIRQMMDAKLLRDSDPQRAAEDFLALALGQLRVRRLFGGAAEPADSELQARAKHAVEVFMRAYAP